MTRNTSASCVHTRRQALRWGLALATLAGLVMACGIGLYFQHGSGSFPILAILALTVATVPTSVVIWGVAYGFWSDDPGPPVSPG